MQSSSFPKVSTITESKLFSKSVQDRYTRGDIYKVSLLGATYMRQKRRIEKRSTKEEEEKVEEEEDEKTSVIKPTLLYLLLEHRAQAKFNNNAQMAAHVLNNSKRLFFERILTLLDAFDATKAELTYVDTDSTYWAMHTHDICKLFKEELTNEERTRVLSDTFEDTRLAHHQGGKFKVEAVAQSSSFRAMKSYRLSGLLPLLNTNLNDSSLPLVKEEKETTATASAATSTTRMRSIPRKLHALLEDKHFSQDPLCNAGYVQGYRFRALASQEIVLSRDGRHLSIGLNMRRVAHVRIRL